MGITIGLIVGRFADIRSILVRQSSFCGAIIGACLCMTSPLFATVGCSVSSGSTGSENVKLYSEPDGASKVLRKIPLGDIVLYPEEEEAPAQAEGWIWIRHDLHQEGIWQSGIFGWVLVENLSDCG